VDDIGLGWQETQETTACRIVKVLPAQFALDLSPTAGKRMEQPTHDTHSTHVTRQRFKPSMEDP